MVGPLSARDGRPLPPDLEKFVINSGGHGFIIVSFGSNVASILSRKVVDMLAETFGKLKQKVVWRLKGISVINSSNNQSVRNLISRVCLLFPSLQTQTYFQPSRRRRQATAGNTYAFFVRFLD